ncbi:MAG: FAD-dependent oxidoreductase [Hyphomonadaceae bacterium]|nr:FAD-dependent oxidoreductase [Hyphomonadaceae bacterium]
MQSTPHIVIIGAGLIGLSTADSLNRRGVRLTVLDRNVGPAQGSSFCNSGMIHPSQARPWHRPDIDAETLKDLVETGNLSRHLIEARMRGLGLSDADRQTGCVQLFDSRYPGEEALEKYRDIGVEAKVINGEPFTYGRYALLFPNDFSGDARRYCCALEHDLHSRGVEFFYKLENINIDKNSLTVSMQNTEIKADHIILAAGTGSINLGRQIGLDIPVKAVRGHTLNFEKPDTPLPARPIIHDASHSALTVFEDQIRLSGTIGKDDPEVLRDIWENIAPDIVRRLAEPISRWSGDRPVSETGCPLIGPTDISGIWLNAGHGHMGWTLCAGSGEKLADMIMQ